MENTVAVLALLVIAYAAVSRPVAGSVLTGPMLFTAAGLALGEAGLGVLRLDIDGEAVKVLTEVTLVLVLFTDAARIDLVRLRRQASLPARMLASLPLVILLGALLAWVVLPGLSLLQAAVLAAVLAPTDAALGQAVVSDERLPVRVRQTLNVESGLNDGIVLPMITILLAVAEAEEGLTGVSGALGFVARQVGFGVGIGLAVGMAGAWVIDRSTARGWMEPGFQQLATLATALASFVLAEAAGGNGFICAFVGGMAFGWVARERCSGVYEFSEEEGTLLTLLVFALLGATLAPQQLQALDGRTILYVLLSLTVVRMVPIAISLLGTGLRTDTMAFLGWFGPRGLATILFVLLVVEEVGVEGSQRIASTALWTVLASVLLHGLTAVPLTSVYARRLTGLAHHEPEMLPMPELTTRG